MDSIFDTLIQPPINSTAKWCQRCIFYDIGEKCINSKCNCHNSLYCHTCYCKHQNICIVCSHSCSEAEDIYCDFCNLHFLPKKKMKRTKKIYTKTNKGTRTQLKIKKPVCFCCNQNT